MHAAFAKALHRCQNPTALTRAALTESVAPVARSLSLALKQAAEWRDELTAAELAPDALPTLRDHTEKFHTLVRSIEADCQAVIEGLRRLPHSFAQLERVAKEEEDRHRKLDK